MGLTLGNKIGIGSIQKGALLNYNYFVDSVNGSDLNSGRSPITPLQTLSALPTLTSGIKIGLAKGSYFRENVKATVDNVVVGAYGEGNRPIIDCADIVLNSAFVKDATKTNVYTTVHTHEQAGTDVNYVSVWENGIRLNWVANSTLCDSTPGSYYVATAVGTSATIYLHPKNSTIPTSDGKLYEATKRGFAVRLLNNSIIKDIHGKRNGANYGSLVLNMNAYAYNCFAEDGVMHNLFIGSGTAKECFAWKIDKPTRTNNSYFVGYQDSGVGKTVTFEKCTVRGSNYLFGSDAFIVHTISDSAKFEQVNIVDCSVVDTKGIYSVTNTKEVNYIRSYIKLGHFVAGGDVCNVTDCMIQCFDTAAALTNIYGIINNSPQLNVRGLRCLQSGATNTAIIYGKNRMSVKNSVFVNVQGWGYNFGIRSSATGTRLESENNIFVAMNNVYFLDAGSYNETSENNIFKTGVNWRENGTSYTYAAYKAAYPTFDLNTSVEDPLFVDANNGNFNLQAGSPAIGIGAGLENPNIVYTPVPINM